MVVYSRHSYYAPRMYYIRKVGGICLPQEISKLLTKSSSINLLSKISIQSAHASPHQEDYGCHICI